MKRGRQTRPRRPPVIAERFAGMSLDSDWSKASLHEGNWEGICHTPFHRELFVYHGRAAQRFRFFIFQFQAAWLLCANCMSPEQAVGLWRLGSIGHPNRNCLFGDYNIEEACHWMAIMATKDIKKQKVRSHKHSTAWLFIPTNAVWGIAALFILQLAITNIAILIACSKVTGLCGGITVICVCRVARISWK